jgi:hypothetical protein
VTLHHGPFKQLAQIGQDFVDNSLSSPIGLFHLKILLLKLVQLPLEVEVLLFLHHFALFRGRIIFSEEAFGLVVDEVAQHLK